MVRFQALGTGYVSTQLASGSEAYLIAERPTAHNHTAIDRVSELHLDSRPFVVDDLLFLFENEGLDWTSIHVN